MPVVYNFGHPANSDALSISGYNGCSVAQLQDRNSFLSADPEYKMAGGWSRDGAVQDQIDASVEDAVNLARSRLNAGESLEFCEECDADIPQARREAVPGVRYCVKCQSELDKQQTALSGFNRRASKDSQLR